MGSAGAVTRSPALAQGRPGVSLRAAIRRSRQLTHDNNSLLACPHCDRLCDHCRAATTTAPAPSSMHSRLCSRCGSGHLVAHLRSEQALRDRLEAPYGQQRLFD